MTNDRGLTKAEYVERCWNAADHYSPDGTRYYTSCTCSCCADGFTRENVADSWDEATAAGYVALASGPWTNR